MPVVQPVIQLLALPQVNVFAILIMFRLEIQFLLFVLPKQVVVQQKQQKPMDFAYAIMVMFKIRLMVLAHAQL